VAVGALAVWVATGAWHWPGQLATAGQPPPPLAVTELTEKTEDLKCMTEERSIPTYSTIEL
jgi:hypothetical protein